MIGQVVCSAKGRDRGELLVVVGFDGAFPLVCNGKDRRKEKPKKKNPKHLKFTDAFLTSKQLNSNSSIRKALNALSAKPTDMEEKECQNQI